MADIGEIKAKVSVEYDGSGIKQAKEDLASLAQATGGAGEGAVQASEKMAGFGSQMSTNAVQAREFSSILAELPKTVEGGGGAVAEMTDALVEQRSAIEEAGAAQETFNKQVESTASTVEKATPSIQTATEHTQKFAQSVQTVSESFDSSMLNDFVENTAVFQDAMVNPQPFAVIGQHLRETGQTWQDFTSSLSANDEAMAYEMAGNAGVTSDHLDMLGAQLQATGRSLTESAGGAAEFTQQFNTLADSTASASKAINEFGGVGEALYGPSMMNEFGGVGEALYGPLEGMKSASLGGAFSEVMGGVTGVLNDIAMPLMAVQMIGMAIGQVGQAMYDSAAIAEGPAAHSFGSFTGTVDALGQSLQKASGQFSEGFGQALIPTLNALNNQAGSSDLGGLGQFVGGVASTLTNLSLITTGIDPWGGVQGLINQGAAMIGVQQPFQGPAPVSQYQQQMAAMPQTIRQATQQTQYQANLTMEEAVNPEFLAAQQQAQAAQTIYQRAQQSYNISHPVNLQKMADNAQYDLYAQQQQENYQYQMNNQPSWAQDIGDYWGGFFGSVGRTPPPLSNPNARSAAQGYGSNYYGQTGYGGDQGTGGGGSISDFFGGIGKSISDFWNQPNGGADTLGMLFSPQAWGFGQSPQTSMGGCFIAGTPVLMAGGTEKPIETLRVDERVLSYDGQRQVPATIIGCISFPSKQTYALTFDDGNVLVTTDSHPIATPDGWKSISPVSTAQENPGLPVTTLTIGDSVYTADGTLCQLMSIVKREIEQVYNITVDTVHTYYASNILVHNAKASSVGSMTNGGVGSEQVQLNHTFTANVQWEANNLQKQFTGAASWVGQGLTNTFQGAASWVAQGLSNTFQGVANWVGQGLSNTFNGIANWVGQNLANTFNGVADWVGQNLSNTFNGVASWAGQGLTNTFKGVASWVGSGLEHTFNAVANWTAQNLTPNFTVNPSFTMLAEGTSNWSGGPAIVGEAGPEVVESNGQYSMFDAGASLVNLPPGANVYPMKDLAGSSVAQFANGTGNILPLNIGVKNQGGNMPESINVYLQIDGQTFWSATGMSLAQSVYVGSGNRSY